MQQVSAVCGHHFLFLLPWRSLSGNPVSDGRVSEIPHSWHGCVSSRYAILLLKHFQWNVCHYQMCIFVGADCNEIVKGGNQVYFMCTSSIFWVISPCLILHAKLYCVLYNVQNVQPSECFCTLKDIALRNHFHQHLSLGYYSSVV